MGAGVAEKKKRIGILIHLHYVQNQKKKFCLYLYLNAKKTKKQRDSLVQVDQSTWQWWSGKHVSLYEGWEAVALR